MELFADLLASRALSCGNFATSRASSTLVWQLLKSSHGWALKSWFWIILNGMVRNREAALLVAKKALGWHKAPKSIEPEQACP